MLKILIIVLVLKFLYRFDTPTITCDAYDQNSV